MNFKRFALMRFKVILMRDTVYVIIKTVSDFSQGLITMTKQMGGHLLTKTNVMRLLDPRHGISGIQNKILLIRCETFYSVC